MDLQCLIEVHEYMYQLTEKLRGMGENLKKEAILYVEWVNIIFSCGSKRTECTQSFLFCGGGAKSVFDMYGCCRVAHVNRTLPKYTIPYIITITVDVVPKKYKNLISILV